MGEDGQGDRPVVSLSPSAEYPPLDPQELDALRELGRQWPTTDGRNQLPVDPALGRFSDPPTVSRFNRLADVRLFRPEAPNELVATEPATQPESRLGRWLTRVRRVALGPPLTSAAVVQERMRKLIALPVLSSDLISSVAYGPEAMVAVLVLAGSAALGLSLPLAAGLVVLMLAVGVSYRQTIPAYPHGAGSYIVASDNLGPRAGLAAGAGLMLDYVLTVAVSVASGVAAITSALPRLAPLAVPLGLAVIGVLFAGNLRGVRASGKLFAAPTYVFIVAVGVLLVVGLARAAGRGFAPVPPPPIAPAEGLGVVLVLRAFASGATSMTGIEAVSNAVPVFQAPEWRHARTTLTWMIGLLITLFTGLILLTHLNGVVPQPHQTLLSQLAHRTFPSGPWYAFIQAATALILLLAANTSFNDFPRVLYFIARDGYAPRNFLRMGDRLAFRNGIATLAVAAAVLLVAFHGYTEALIPLYAVGVFLAFTLSQAGMVVHWRRHRTGRWRRSLAINAAGALLSGLVLITAAVTKFLAGAWVVVLAVPLMVLLGLRIRRHYDAVGEALSHRPPSDAAGEGQERPDQVRHLAVVPVARLDRAALRALAYVASLGQPAFAVHISPDDEEDERFRAQWEAWGDHLPLEIIVSPYRAIIPPLAHYLEALHALRPDVTLTVIVPEAVVRSGWHRLLHSNTPQRLRRALSHLTGVVVTSVPIHVTV
jgi:amino acid transporter